MKNKNALQFYLVLAIGFIILLFPSCEKDETNPTSTITDIDGNVYHTVTIGKQTWMVENLKVTKYNDGIAIPLITDNIEWNNLSTGAFCNFNNDESKASTYGRLFNWNAVNTGKLCPSGWHVPSDTEWTTLTDYLGGESVAGGKLKETDTIHWMDPNIGATNETNFTALPGGSRSFEGIYYNINYGGYWWCTTDYDTIDAWIRYMVYGRTEVFRYNATKQSGLSVRCLKD